MRLCSRASLKLVKYTALCDIVHCNPCLLFIILFLSVKRLVLFHPITHSPCCEHLISPLSFQHPVFQHQFTSLSGSPRIVTRVWLSHSPNWNIIRLYSPHFYPSCITLTLILQYHCFSQYFSLCSSVVSSLASFLFLLFTSPQFTIPLPPTLVHTLPPTLVHTLPFPCCNKNSVKLYLFISLALAKNHQ